MNAAQAPKRFLVPVAVNLLIAIGLYFLNAIELPTENRSLYQLLRNSFLILFYAEVWLSGAVFVYPYLYFRGASLPVRTLAAFVVPVAYILSEMVRVSEFFTWGESLYYGLSTMGLLTLSLQVGLLGLSEMLCRWRAGGQRVFTLRPLAALLFMLAAAYVLILWGAGVHWFYIYQEGYKLLFGR